MHKSGKKSIIYFYVKYNIFQFLSRGMHMHIPMLTGIQNGRIICQKTEFFAKKCSF